MGILLDGKKIAEEVLLEITEVVDKRKKNGHRPPHLAAVLIGNDGASETYVANKVKTCERIGFTSTLIRLSETASEDEVLEIIENLNNDENIDGYIVQLPLPKHISEKKITSAIKPEKDVDGFHPVNVGKLALSLPTYISATPNGVVEMLRRNNIPTEGKHCVVIGRSNIVGSPMSILMSKNTYPGNCTVTLCHSKSNNLRSLTLQADILIVAIGKPLFITADMVKPGVVVIDVGMHRIADVSKKSGYRLVGDVDFSQVEPIASYITPVPGGVGLMTIASLMQNTLKAATKEVYL